MNIGVIGLGTTGLGICSLLRQSYGELSHLKGLYRENLKRSIECSELNISTYPYSSLESFLNNLDWVIITINKDWFNITQSILHYLPSSTSLIFISSTSVYGDKKGASVSVDTSLDISIVREQIKGLISAEQLVIERGKSYVLRSGLLYESKQELCECLSQVNPLYSSYYINITQRNRLYECVIKCIDNKTEASISNVVSKSLRVSELCEELGIVSNGIYPLHSNVYIVN